MDDVTSRARGCILGFMIGDALGAGVEGWPPEEIAALAQKRWGSPLIVDFFDAVHMASYVSAGQPGMYREAYPLEQNASFVPTGPPSNEGVARQCCRRGMYTDDSNSSLALAASIVEQGGVDAQAVALSYASFWLEGDAMRGYPLSAQQVMQAVRDGVSIHVTGLPPHFPFEGGSFANGAAMRISPLAIAYRHADRSLLRRAVEAAVWSSHRHPEALDFAMVQAFAVQHALRCATPDAFQPMTLLKVLSECCVSEGMRRVIDATAVALAEQYTVMYYTEGAEEEWSLVEKIVSTERRPGSGMGFQIASVHMAPCVLWCVCRHYERPGYAIQQAIALGGDTDTTACMVGAIVGALWGEEWAGTWAAQLENGTRGRDYALDLAEKLAVMTPSEPVF